MHCFPHTSELKNSFKTPLNPHERKKKQTSLKGTIWYLYIAYHVHMHANMHAEHFGKKCNKISPRGGLQSRNKQGTRPFREVITIKKLLLRLMVDFCFLLGGGQNCLTFIPDLYGLMPN